jgi:hypothetical protein
MKKQLKAAAVILLLLMTTTANAQVLISLLFGNALNSEKVEFGLTGGWDRSYLKDIPTSNGLNDFNLGFYFHLMLKNNPNSYISTGVLVKSAVGATGMTPYSTGDEAFDSLYADGNLTKKIHYFYVPIMYQRRFNNRWFMEGGVQLGLRNKAQDIMDVSFEDGELEYTVSTKSEYKHLDAGLVGGAGYKFKKEQKSISAGFLYYYGLMNISEEPGTTLKNSALYVYIRIPIGAGGKKKDTSSAPEPKK